MIYREVCGFYGRAFEPRGSICV